MTGQAGDEENHKEEMYNTHNNDNYFNTVTVSGFVQSY